MKLKYFPAKKCLTAKAQPYHSRIWKEVTFMKALIRKEMKWDIRSGTKVFIWTDTWIDKAGTVLE